MTEKTFYINHGEDAKAFIGALEAIDLPAKVEFKEDIILVTTLDVREAYLMFHEYIG